jgi:hypothetical protein
MSAFEATGTWRIHDRNPERYGVPCKPSRYVHLGYKALCAYLLSKGYGSKSEGSADAILATIPDRLKHYWFRGLFDGDGYITYTKSGVSAIRITSSYNQDWRYLEQACQSLGITFHVRRDRYTNRHGKVNSRSVFSITNAKGIKTFCDYIYQGWDTDGFGLKRKHTKWLELASYLKTRPKVGHIFI